MTGVQTCALPISRIELLELQSKRLQDSMLELNGTIARIEQSMKDLIAALRNRVDISEVTGNV